MVTASVWAISDPFVTSAHTSQYVWFPVESLLKLALPSTSASASSHKKKKIAEQWKGFSWNFTL
jgi:hypothetical protein